MSSSITGFRVQRINDLESLQRFHAFEYDDDNDDGFLIDNVFQQFGMGRPLSDADSTVVCDSVAIGGKSHGGSSSRSSNHDDHNGGGDADLVSSVFQQLRMGQPPSDDVDDIINHHHDSSSTTTGSLAVGSRVIIIENNVPSTIDEEDTLVADIFDQLGMGTPPSDDEASDLGSYTSDHIDHEEDNYGGRRRRRTGPSSSANGSNSRRRRRSRFPGMVRNFARRFRR